MLPFLGGSSGNEVVEDVEVTLAGGHTCHAISLEVVIEGFDTAEAATITELKLCVFPEPGGVGVEESASISKCLEHEFGCRNLGGEF